MAAAHLWVVYPDPATRPKHCGACTMNATNAGGWLGGMSNGAWCNVTDTERDVGDECNCNSYVERPQPTEEEARELSKRYGWDTWKQLLELAKKATPEDLAATIDVGDGVKLFAVATPGKQIRPTGYDTGDAA